MAASMLPTCTVLLLGFVSQLILSSITNLVGFALKLRNLGVSDHQLIKALSAPLAGSLYSGEGHSRLYDEEAIYEYVSSYLLHAQPR